MVEPTSLGGKAIIISKEKDLNQGGCSSYSNIYDELFQNSFGSLSWNWKYHWEVLVGTKGWPRKNSLGELDAFCQPKNEVLGKNPNPLNVYVRIKIYNYQAIKILWKKKNSESTT